MDAQSAEETQRLQDLSALADGELSRQATARVCAAWRESPDCREAWHTWALIGDVMRSPELTSTARHDRSLLAGVQARLAQEPVVLAPHVLPEPEVQPALLAVGAGHVPAVRRRHVWRAPVAVAAGCAMVAGALWVSRSIGTGEAAGGLQAGAAAGNTMAMAPADPAVTRTSADVDRYLQAHRRYVHGSALVMPGGFRQVAADAH